MINAKDMLEITMNNIPMAVYEGAEKVMKNILECAMKGKRKCNCSIDSDLWEYKPTIVMILANNGYRLTYSENGCALDITW